MNKLELVNLILPWAAFHLCLSLRVSTWSWLEQLCLIDDNRFFWLIQSTLLFLSYVTLISWFNKYQRLELYDSSWHDWYLILKHSLVLLNHIRYLDVKTSACSSPMYDSSQPSPCWSFFNYHHDPHNPLCLQWAYVDNSLQCWCRWIIFMF
jgi:hypothetical protein